MAADSAGSRGRGRVGATAVRLRRGAMLEQQLYGFETACVVARADDGAQQRRQTKRIAAVDGCAGLGPARPMNATVEEEFRIVLYGHRT